jgi:serine/threonine protein kinase
MSEDRKGKLGNMDFDKSYATKPVKVNMTTFKVEGYSLKEEIGAGAFGRVYVTEQDPGKVLKIQYVGGKSTKPDCSNLNEEVRLQNLVAKTGHAGRIKLFGPINFNRHVYNDEPEEERVFFYSLMPRYEDSLEEIQKRFPVFDHVSVQKLGVQLFRGIEAMHTAGILHCDLKNDNVMFVKDEDGIHVRFVDFGLSEVIDNNQINDKKKKLTPKGTPNLMSRNCHEGKRLTRLDDTESILYMLIKLVNGRLPWSNLNKDDRDLNTKILESKKSWWGPRLCAGLPEVF